MASGIIGMTAAHRGQVSLPVHTAALALDISTANVKRLRTFASCLRPAVSHCVAVSEHTMLCYASLGSGRGHIYTVPWMLMEPLHTVLARLPRIGLSCLRAEFSAEAHLLILFTH